MNIKSKIKAQIAIAICLGQSDFAIMKGTIALNMNVKTWTIKVASVLFKNFSNLFCFISAFDASSIYFFSDFI